MEFLFKTVGTSVHLCRCGSLFNEDLGALSKTVTGMLRTNRLLGPTYELRDISGPFAKGQRYSIKGTDGVHGTLKKKFMSDNRYILE